LALPVPWHPCIEGHVIMSSISTLFHGCSSLRNVVSRLLPRSGGAFLRRRRWSRGVLCWRSALALLRLGQMMLLLVSFFFKGTEHASGFVDGGWLDLSQPSLGDGGGCLASSDPGAGGGGARPRSMGDRRWLLQLRLLSKPTWDGSSSAQGGARLPLRWRWPVARRAT